MISYLLETTESRDQTSVNPGIKANMNRKIIIWVDQKEGGGPDLPHPSFGDYHSS